MSDVFVTPPDKAKPVTVRFTPDELDLMSAVGRVLAKTAGARKLSRSAVIRRGLKALKPPEADRVAGGLDPDVAEWRRAYRKVYG